MVLAGGMLCDLHWHLLVTPNARARFAPVHGGAGRTASAGRPVGDHDGGHARSVDGILYLCLHGSLSGGHQLVWLKDIDQMIDSEPPDWDELVRRARLGPSRTWWPPSNWPGAGPCSAPAFPRRWWTRWPGGPAGGGCGSRQEDRQGMARWGGYDRTGRTFLAATSGGTLDQRRPARPLAGVRRRRPGGGPVTGCPGRRRGCHRRPSIGGPTIPTGRRSVAGRATSTW